MKDITHLKIISKARQLNIKHIIKFTSVIYLIFISILLSLLFGILSCHNPVSPLEDKPGRRDYTWTVDTLEMEMNFISTIWGASANNVWAMGASGDARNRLWHFDGSIWSVYNKEAVFCGGWSLFGFSSDNVWMGGDDEGSNGASIWHFDGKNWKPNYFYNIQDSYQISINKIFGSNPNDIYACGRVGYYKNGESSFISFVLHYNGNKWEEVVRGSLNDQFVNIIEENSIAYVYSQNLSHLGTNYNTLSFYEVDSASLKEIYSNTEGNINWINIFSIGGKLFFLIDKNVCFYRGDKFITQFSINKTNFSFYLFGRNEKDIFLNMKDGLAHYNGEDIEYLLHYPEYSRSFGEAAVFDKDVFQVYYDNLTKKNMVLHGRLK